METIKPGKFVELIYDLYEVEGSSEVLMMKATDELPDRFVFGVDQNMLDAFTQALNGLKQGDKFDIVLGPDQAFGERIDEYVMDFDKEMFFVDGKFDDERIKEKNVIEMMTADGHRVAGEVITVGPEKVTVDFNHPLAGQTVRYVGEVRVVRDATPEELQPKSCGCDHDCGGDDHDCCDGGCGSCH